MNSNPDRNIRIFVAIMLTYQLLLAVLVTAYGYKGSFLLLNGLHADALDAPMFLLTHLGDALILTSLLGFLLTGKRPALVILLIVVVVVTGLTGQLMKNFLFNSWERPLSVLGENGEVFTVYGYRLFRNSFPSGHSITVVAAITSLVLVQKPGKPVMVLLALLAALVSYTRIYVGAHFAGDVLAGTIIGLSGSAYLTFRLYPSIQRWVDQRQGKALTGFKTGLYILAGIGFSGGIIMIGDYLKQMIHLP
jgi:undecaprenyl-diphosphatase